MMKTARMIGKFCPFEKRQFITDLKVHYTVSIMLKPEFLLISKNTTVEVLRLLIILLYELKIKFEKICKLIQR